MNRQELILKLEKLGFSKLESQIYLVLLDHGSMSAYQIAKKIDISRSSIYNCLEHMVEKGMVETIPNDTALYIAQTPDILLGQLQTEYIANSIAAIKFLDEYKRVSYNEEYANLYGYNQIIYRIKDLIKNAKRDVYINTDYHLDDFEEEICEARKRDVQTVVFSFNDIRVDCSMVQYYSHMRQMEQIDKFNRFMIVVDQEMVLIADYNVHKDNWNATITNNKLMVHIILEHIHNDIYLLKLRDEYGSNIYDKIRVGTLYEKMRMEEV